MDETLQELENELKRLTPRQPSVGLLQALEHDLGAAAATGSAPRYSSATNLRAWKWTSWALAGVAAIIAVVVLLQSHRTPTLPKASSSPDQVATAPLARPAPAELVADRYEPVKATAVLYDLQESDPTTLPDQTEGREVRYRYVDTYTWKNPATNASLRWSVPRDEVRLVRASLD